MQEHSAQTGPVGAAHQAVIGDIRDLAWSDLTRDDLIGVAWAYYPFSIQFRENLEVALDLHPGDAMLRELDRGERDTDNLSPWPGVAKPGEKMDHDEFMRRTLALTAIDARRQRRFEALGRTYLATARGVDKMSRALSIASYENGGLDTVYRSMLRAPHWEAPLLGAFRHFLTEHIKFDGDPDHGHGALCRHLTADDRVLPLWTAFREMLLEAVPLLGQPRHAAASD